MERTCEHEREFLDINDMIYLQGPDIRTPAQVFYCMTPAATAVCLYERRPVMKKYFAMLLILFCAALILSPLSGVMAEQEKDDKTQQKNEGPGYRFTRDNIGLIVDNDGKMTQVEDEAIQVLNKRGIERFTQVVRLFNSSRTRIDVLLARVIQPDGKSVMVPSTQIKESEIPAFKKSPLYRNMKMKVITFTDLVPGSTIEYRINTVTEKPYPGKAFFETSYTQDYGVLAETSFFAEIPRNRKLNYFTPLYKDVVKPRITHDSGKTQYIWEFKKVEPVKEEVAMPSLQDLASRVLVGSFESWNDVGSFLNDLMKDHMAYTDEMKEKVSQITGDSKGLEKVRLIYAWLSRDKEIVDINMGSAGYDFHDASLIMKEKIVSARDFTLLLLTILKGEGYEAYPALASSTTTGTVYSEIPTIQQFDSILVALSMDNTMRWIEPAEAHGGIDSLSSDLQGRPVLLVKGDSSDFVSTPQSAFVDNREEMRAEMKLNDDGSLDGVLKFSEFGSNKMQWLRIYNSLGERERSNIPRILLAQINPLVLIIDHSFRDNSQAKGPFSIQARFRINDFAARSGDTWNVKLPLIAGSGMRDILSIDPDKRTWPLVVGSPFQEDRRLHIIIPAGAQIKSLPRDILIENASGTFQVICSTSGTDLWYYSRMVVRKGVIPQSEIKAFIDILSAAVKAGKEQIILEKRKAL